MYTDTGRNHLNLHTAGQVTSVATHIVMGLDSLNTTGDTPPLLTDRYLGAYQSAKIPIINSSVVEGDIVFASSYDTATVPMFLGNTMGLVFDNGAAESRQRVRKSLFNDFNGGWYGTVALDDTNTPAAWPDINGGMIIAENTTAATEGLYSLAPYTGVDFLSIPVFFYGAAPTSGNLTVTFTFKVAGVDTTYSISDTIISASPRYRFTNSVPALFTDGVVITTNLLKPRPIVWQMRLNAGTSPATFLANLANIWKVQFNWSVGTACKLYVGAPQITPDYDADNASIVIAHGKLSADVAHTGQSYLAAEYRLPGVTAA